MADSADKASAASEPVYSNPSMTEPNQIEIEAPTRRKSQVDNKSISGTKRAKSPEDSSTFPVTAAGFTSGKSNVTATTKPVRDAGSILNGRDDREEDEDDSESLDSFGIPVYEERYPNPVDYARGQLCVPWNMRNVAMSRRCTFFAFLLQPQFWKQFEFATRITAIAVLVPSAIIASGINQPFVSAYMPMSASVLAAKGSVGEAVCYIFTWIRAGCFWLPLGVIGGALKLGHHMAGWCIYYTAMLFIMAVFTEAMVRRICLLLFNSCMVGLLVNLDRGAVYSCRVMVDWCIGTGLCTCAAFFPYPIFCKKEAHRLLGEIAKNTGTAFRGLVYSFWSPSNIERNMAMSKVRTMTDSLDGLLARFEHSQAFAFYEFFFESTEVREIRDLKFKLFENLRVNLSSMTRVLDMVEDSPSSIDDSDRSKAFGELLTPHLDNVAAAFDELMEELSHAKTRQAVADIKPSVDQLRARTHELQDAYRLARRMLFYEHTSDTIEEFVPLMTFYLFTVVCFRDTIDLYELKVHQYTPSTLNTCKLIFKKTAWQPFMDNMHFIKDLFTRWNRRDVQRVIEAAKVSGAMILTIGFSFLIKVEKASFSGPNIIAFVSGSNPVEAVQASIVRLTGCLIGTVLGFFAGTYSKTPVQRVASLCTLMFCGTFLRNDKEYGIMSVYAMFVLIPLDSILQTTVTDTISRMNQNTFGIFIYLFVSILVFPLSPSKILRMKRCNVLFRMDEVLGKLCELFVTPLRTEKALSQLMGGQTTALNMSPIGEESGSTDDTPSTLPGRPVMSNRSMYMVLGNDECMEDINKGVADIIRRLRGTKEFMGFAHDERGLVEIDYPVKACSETYLHMYRMTFLLKTMSMSWNVIRSQRVSHSGTRHMLNSLHRVMQDCSRSFTRFTNLTTHMIMIPAVNLEGELMKAILDLEESTKELNRRKSQIMLMLIRESVEAYRSGLAGGALHSSDDEDGGVARRRLTRPPTTGRLDEEPAFSMYGRQSSARTLQETHGLQRFNTFSGHEMSSAAGTGRFLGSPTARHGPRYSPNTVMVGNFRMVPSERNVTVNHLLHHRQLTQGTEHEAASSKQEPEGPVRLPADFVFPVSSEDAEGLHSFGLCLEIFSDEAKKLMMSIGTMVDHLRSKL